MPEFNADAAKAAGYSDAEIAKVQQGIAAARAAGYSDSEISQFISSNFGASNQVVSSAPPPEPILERAGRQVLGSALSGIAQMTPGLPAALGNALFPSPYWPTPARMAGAIGQLTGARELGAQPQGPLEAGAYGAVRGASAAIPAALALGPAGIPGVVATLGSGALAGGVEDYARAAGYSNPEALGTAAGVLGGGLGAGAFRTGEAALGQFNPRAAALAEAGLPLRSPALTSESALVRRLLTPGIPRETIQQDIGGVLENTASSLGSSRNPAQLGTTAQDSIRGWVHPDVPFGDPVPANSFPGRQAAIWEPVNSAIPPETPVEFTNLRRTLDSIAGKGGKLAEAENLLRSQLPDRLRGVLFGTLGEGTPLPPPRPQATPGVSPGGSPGTPRMMNPPKGLAALPPGGLRMMGGVAPGTGPVNWSDAAGLQSALGDALGSPRIVSDIGQDNINKLYAALAEDRRAAARSVGQEDLFNSANEASSELYRFRDNVLSRVIKSGTGNRETIQPEDAGRYLLGTLRKGDSTISQLRQFGLRNVANEIAATYLRLNGLDSPASLVSPVGKNWSSAWKSLQTAGVDSSLFDPDTARKLDTLANLSSDISAIKPSSGISSPAIIAGILGGGHAAGVAGLGLHLAGYGGEALTNYLLGEGIGGFVGGALPYMYHGLVSNNPLVQNILASTYAAAPRAGTILSRGLAAGAGGTENALTPNLPTYP